MRVLSGIQPTGRFHWGNYFGAIRQYIDLQAEDAAYYFIANLHALTTVRDPARLAELTLDAAIDLLALGLDPEPRRAVRAVGRARGLGALLAADDRRADGIARTLPRLQGQEGQGAPGRRRTVHLSGADGGRHSGVRLRHRAGGRRPGAAHRGLPRPGGQLQPSLRPDVRAAQGQAARCVGQGAGYSTARRCRRATTTRSSCSRMPRPSGKRSCGSSPIRGRWTSPRSPRPTTCSSFSRWWPVPHERDEMAALYRRGGFGYGEVKKALADAAERFFAEPRRGGPNWPPSPSGFAKSSPTAPPEPAVRRRRCWTGRSCACGLVRFG